MLTRSLLLATTILAVAGSVQAARASVSPAAETSSWCTITTQPLSLAKNGADDGAGHDRGNDRGNDGAGHASNTDIGAARVILARNGGGDSGGGNSGGGNSGGGNSGGSSAGERNGNHSERGEARGQERGEARGQQRNEAGDDRGGARVGGRGRGADDAVPHR